MTAHDLPSLCHTVQQLDDAVIPDEEALGHLPDGQFLALPAVREPDQKLMLPRFDF